MPTVAPTSLPLPEPRRRRVPLGWLALLLGFALFGWGVVELFELRFAAGDVYPPYSTLRNDPLGAAAFYEALDGQPGLRVERNLRPLDRLGKPPAVLYGHAPTPAAEQAGRLTVFYLGADAYRWPTGLDKPGAARLEEILNEGDRVVLTFLPADTPLTAERLEHNRETGEPTPAASPNKEPERTRRAREAARPADLAKRWQIDFRRPPPKPKIEPKNTRERAAAARAVMEPTPAPEASGEGKEATAVAGGEFADADAAPWHTVADFQLDSPEAKAAGWHALYEREGKPVIVARPFGAKGGELVLASDSYFLSNEALRVEPHAALLAGLVGDARRVIFDESHQGLAENPGLMTLARRYGLQGALAATALLAGLFIWRNVLSLVPPPPVDAAGRAGTATGRDSAAGFLNLLRRGVPSRELVRTCLAQWQSGVGRRAPDPAVVERLRAAVEEGSRRDPAAAYRAVCAAVKRKG